MGRRFPFNHSSLAAPISRWRRKSNSSIIPIFVVLLLAIFSSSNALGTDGSRLVRGVKARGSCAITDMSGNQSQLIALQRARATAIEEAVGISIGAATLVKDGSLAVEFIRTYSRGFIVKEEVSWLPISQYRPDPAKPPIPEYTVEIIVDISIPEKRIKPLGLVSRLNNSVFRRGEKAKIEIRTEKDARYAVFNFTAEDKVLMLFPNPWDEENRIRGGQGIMFPREDSRIEVVMETLPGHRKDAEALFVVALDAEQEREFKTIFPFQESMSFSEFFERFSGIAAYAEERILPYEVSRE